MIITTINFTSTICTFQMMNQI